VNSGPAPDPNALRRDRPSDKDGWLTLPAAGYQGEIPEWPIDAPLSGFRGGKAIESYVVGREADLWDQLWRTPQATVWITNPATVNEVALYCRLEAIAETGHVMIASEKRQLGDRLGIDPASMARLRWKVEGATDAKAKPRERRSEAEEARESARERFKAIGA
jgi:hypothetical protein